MARQDETEEGVVESSEREDQSPPPESVKSGDEEGEEEEYEIEQILEAKRGVFGKGKYGYLVKWKGYGPEHNSWVNEEDADNARDLINEYWRLHNQKKAPRKSMESASVSKASQSSATRDKSPLVESTGGTKRGRGRPPKATKKASTSISDTEEENDFDDVDTYVRKTKKAKRGSTQNGRLKQQRSFAELNKDTDADMAMDSDTQVEEHEIKFFSMKNYMNSQDWETLVQTIDTVERQEDGDLIVYFTLTDGKRVREKSELCGKRFPQKLIEFYESHLKWKSLEEIQV